MTEMFGYYLRLYVTANFGEKYDDGVKLMLDAGLLNETAAQCAVICCYVDIWCMTHSGKRQEAFAEAAETFGIAVYTVRHYYYDLKKGTISSTKTRHVRALVSNFMWIFCVRLRTCQE